MIKTMAFSDCLRTLLSISGISINRLSRAINVDNSLVNRWVNGKRIPPYNTLYIEQISEYICRNIKNSFQEQHIDELFSSVYMLHETISSLEEKIKIILLESQGYSIKHKKKEPLTNSKKAHSINNKLISSVDLSSEDKLILGIDNTFSVGVALLEAASKQKSKNKQTIYITYNNDLNTSSHHRNNLLLYRDTMFKAIDNGWHILLLINLNKNVSKMINFIHFIIPLIVTGKFTIHYTHKYENTPSFDENMIVPNIGSLSFMSMSVNSKNSYAFYVQNPVAVNIIEKHFKEFISMNTKPLLNYYSSQDNINYSSSLVEMEKSMGNRFLYKYGFSVLMLPPDLYTRLLQKKGLSQDTIQNILGFYHQRLDAFKANVAIYEYNDIYLVPCIHDLMRYQEFYLYDYIGMEKVYLEVPDLIDLLKNIIYLLETYEKFNIAFIPPHTENLIKNHDLFCLVKERHAILLETFEFSKTIPRMRLYIEEPTVVRAFEEYLKDILDKVPPIIKDKKEVISWLLRQVDSLKMRLDNNLSQQ